MLSKFTSRILDSARLLSWSRPFLVAVSGGLAAAAVLVAMSAFGAGPRAGAAPYAGAPEGHELVGTWIQEVILPDRRIVNYTTFFSDGTLVGTNSDHLTRSPFHGVWVRTGDRQFAVTQFRLVFDTLGGPNAQ
jgi:hypothetical protein